jgi:hypothetical protein
MAGDWLKMRTDLWDCPQVVRISSALCLQRFATIGALFRTWCIADQYTTDGKLTGYTPESLDAAVGIDGWSRALESIGWLAIDSEGVAIPRFKEHNGKSAKRRAQDAKRKQSCRQSVRKPSAQKADTLRTKCGAREEKRREDIRGSARTRDDGDWESRTPFPKGFDREDVRAHLRQWIAHLAAYRPILDVALTATQSMQRYSTPAEFIEAVSFAIGNNRDYLGRSFSPQPSQPETQRPPAREVT